MGALTKGELMLRFLVKSALLLALCSTILPSADGDPTPPAPAPAPTDAASTPAVPRHIVNTPCLDALHAFCIDHKISLTETGGPQVKLLNLGGAQIANPAVILNMALQTLDGYEVWSGQQEIFASSSRRK